MRINKQDQLRFSVILSYVQMALAIVLSVLFVVLSIFPQIAIGLSELIGIQSPINMIFLIIIFDSYHLSTPSIDSLAMFLRIGLSINTKFFFWLVFQFLC